MRTRRIGVVGHGRRTWVPLPSIGVVRDVHVLVAEDVRSGWDIASLGGAFIPDQDHGA
jgi:hypothetical protein